MAYADLNPIRARIAITPKSSDHTSIKQRVSAAGDGMQPGELIPFAGNPRDPMPEGMPFRLRDYIELVDLSGRCLREDKRGAIDSEPPPILERLQIDPRHWLYLNRHFKSRFKSLVSCAHAVRSACEQLGKRWAHGMRDCERFLSPPTT
ncbi:hypothetical protein [Microbulbifer sp. M83]|uniref:hypothetical protein n=1 Tax=Microbulbifer sp. M83 TaxID=3118246 RepID=UPI002FDFE2E5